LSIFLSFSKDLPVIFWGLSLIACLIIARVVYVLAFSVLSVIGARLQGSENRICRHTPVVPSPQSNR
jgi:hypothetical protein